MSFFIRLLRNAVGLILVAIDLVTRPRKLKWYVKAALPLPYKVQLIKRKRVQFDRRKSEEDNLLIFRKDEDFQIFQVRSPIVPFGKKTRQLTCRNRTI